MQMFREEESYGLVVACDVIVVGSEALGRVVRRMACVCVCVCVSVCVSILLRDDA